MKQDILHDRYDFTENDKAIIDISLDTLGDLFNAFDRKTSFYKRDLNQDFEDYLIASVKELEGHDFIIRLNIEKELTKDSEETIKKAIRNHFRFLYWQERKKFSKVILQFIILTILGIALMAFYNQQNATIKDFNAIPMFSKIVIEGIDIAGWVAFWEAFTILIFGFIPIKQNRRLYQKISQTEIIIKEPTT